MTKQDKQRLFESHKNLVYSIARHIPNFDEDFEQELMEALWRAAITYDPDRAQFSTYAYKVLRNAVANEMRNRAKSARHIIVSIYDTTDEEDSIPLIETLASVSDTTLPIEAKSILEELDVSPRHKAALSMRMRGATLEEIGQALGVTKQRADRILKECGKRYKEESKNCE